MDTRPKESIAAVQQVFALLDALAQTRWASTAELAACAGLAPTATRRMLRTMASQGYVCEEEGCWRLAMPLFELGARALRPTELLDVAKPVMRDLAEASGEAVQLGLLGDDDIVCLHKVESHRHAIGIAMSIGHPVPMQGSAMGKSLMAWRTGWEPPASRNDFARIRAQGFCELRSAHVYSVAAAIFDHARAPVASLAIYLPNVRFSEAAATQLAAGVRAAAREISQSLGCATAPVGPLRNPVPIGKRLSRCPV